MLLEGRGRGGLAKPPIRRLAMPADQERGSGKTESATDGVIMVYRKLALAIALVFAPQLDPLWGQAPDFASYDQSPPDAAGPATTQHVVEGLLPRAAAIVYGDGMANDAQSAGPCTNCGDAPCRCSTCDGGGTKNPCVSSHKVMFFDNDSATCATATIAATARATR